MPAITVQNLSEETHRALALRAAKHGRSTEAEVREIVEEAVGPQNRLKIGSELAAFNHQFSVSRLILKKIPTPPKPPAFE